MIFVNTQAKLNNFLAQAKSCDIVCLDTEFIREKTYYPQLCLIQAQTRGETFIIDPYEIDDIKALASLFEDENVVKVFHAADQDIELLYQETGSIPNPIFDTQIAASIVSGINQPGLANLLKNTLSIKIDKSEGFTDWTMRPLTDKQINYAAEDVAYLPKLYDYQISKLKELGRESWLKSEFESLTDISKLKNDPYERFIHLKSASHLTQRELCLAREVAAWREKVAMKKNVPRRWVLSDEQVCEICKRDPMYIEELFVIRGVRNLISIRDAREILHCLEKARKVNKDSWPVISGSNTNEVSVTETVYLMNALLRLRAKENGISPLVLASSELLTDLARGKHDGNKLLSGWRKEVVGDELLDILNGKIALSVEDNNLKVHRID